jgi:hypothetical protein
VAALEIVTGQQLTTVQRVDRREWSLDGRYGRMALSASAHLKADSSSAIGDDGWFGVLCLCYLGRDDNFKAIIIL